MEYLKKATLDREAQAETVSGTVSDMLLDIRLNRESAVRKIALKLDGWSGEFILSAGEREALIEQVPEQEKQDIRFAHQQVKHFAEAQRQSISEFAIETEPGVRLGQSLVPVECAGCYVPGGRYAHAASAIMSITTARVAGVPFIVTACPPRGSSIAPAIAYAMDMAGADVILQMGGIQAIATMAFGLFDTRPADILVGPGNAYVAEAKRQLFGEIGIDLLAGPTESAIIADDSADAMTVAVDLAGQAEHGPDSPVWLFTTSRDLGETVLRIMPKLAADMPSGNVVMQAWNNHAEIIVCSSRNEICQVSDSFASEHLQVIAEDLDWWRRNLKNYGSLFLGEGSSVTHGDKCSGTNHILPTKRAARYTGGLNVMKFLKVLTWQQLSRDANLPFSGTGSRISRLEGMDGHARSCDWRLRKYFPDQDWDFEVAEQKRYD
ncbi:MAG: histidinol dehydrogenase [Pseudomonadales bacterium]|jgi:sulfopropanediol 3-dehydrogenase|nr:histidinol dehydrogenase [Gammaproteobacteria bacterium]MDP6026643.1 histidinol dehydrogenase [Pseudomonadales bacterium]MDP7315334.1 histidinol dehydrogenase [Pseudomonadales bacterium]|tara:strand:+ start:651 stop:1958 length:1308 start_codon:yes stop_codon:yes gene_type:complete